MLDQSAITDGLLCLCFRSFYLVKFWIDGLEEASSLVSQLIGWEVAPHLVYDLLPSKDQQWWAFTILKTIQYFDSSARGKRSWSVLKRCWVQQFFLGGHTICCHIYSLLTGDKWQRTLLHKNNMWTKPQIYNLLCTCSWRSYNWQTISMNISGKDLQREGKKKSTKLNESHSLLDISRLSGCPRILSICLSEHSLPY